MPTAAIVGLRVVLVDDSLLVRDGLARILTDQGVKVVGVARSGTEALLEVQRHRPDIVVLDIRMPPSFTNEGVLAAEAIRRSVPSVGILVLAQDAERAHLGRLLGHSRRAIGYLLKDRLADWNQLSDALARIAAGGAAVDPVVVELLMRSGGGERSDHELGTLTDRERTVLALMAEGLANRGIAERMSVSVRTVEGHVASVFGKLGLKDDDSENRRVMAVLEYLKAVPVDS
jgi:DNA-binding NarL/FixJ family response regulator